MKPTSRAGSYGWLCAAVVLSCATGSDQFVARAAAQDAAGLAAALETTFVKTIELAEPSVVSIAREKKRLQAAVDLPFEIGRRNVGGPLQDDSSQSNHIPNEFGTGIIVREDGLILTNYHLVRGGPVEGTAQAAEQELSVRLADRRRFTARIHAADPRSDLAVLKIDASGLKPIKLAHAAPVKKGQIVLALGNPYAIARDGSASASWGIISNISRLADLEGDTGDQQVDEEVRKRQTIHHLGTLLQTDARLNLGTSGGPLLNLRGELIGITTSLAAIVGYEKSAGFAVPIDDASRRVIETLIKGQEVEYGFLGVHLPVRNEPELRDEEYKQIGEKYGQYGAAKLAGVIPNSPASQAGMQAHDIILSVNGKPIHSQVDLTREIGLLEPGTKARLKVLRSERRTELTLDVVVGKWPVMDDEGIVATHRRHEPWRGIVVDYVTARKRFWPPARDRYQDREIPFAVLVRELEAGTPASMADLQPGDFITHVNGRPVHSPQQFYEEANRATGEADLSLASGRKVKIKPR